MLVVSPKTVWPSEGNLIIIGMSVLATYDQITRDVMLKLGLHIQLITTELSVQMLNH